MKIEFYWNLNDLPGVVPNGDGNVDTTSVPGDDSDGLDGLGADGYGDGDEGDAVAEKGVAIRPAVGVVHGCFPPNYTSFL